MLGEVTSLDLLVGVLCSLPRPRRRRSRSAIATDGTRPAAAGENENENENEMGQLNCKDCLKPGPVADADGGRHAWDKDGDGEVSFLERMEGMSGAVVDAAGDVVEYIDDRIDMPVIIDIKGMKSAGEKVYNTSRETSALCRDTVAKSREVVAFGLELKETLDGMSADGTLEASKFETILDLVDGDRMREATKLATELGGLASKCVDQSQDMMEAIELGIDSLPDIIEEFIEDKLELAAEKGTKESDPDLPDVETHTRELQTLVADVDDVNLFTVMSSGKKAFDGLRSKGEVCREMFAAVRDFSDNVTEVSEAIRKFDLWAIGSAKELVADAWRCLRLTSLIKSFAKGVGEIIKWIVSLFKRAAQKLGSIWGALARSKGVLSECVGYVKECIRLCNDAKGQSRELCDLTKEIRDHLRNIVTMDRDAIASMKDLSDGDEIRRAIKLASTMDDIAKECILQIIDTIRKVCGAIKSMPDVLREGMEEGQKEMEIRGGKGKVTRAISFGVEDNDDDPPPEDSVDTTRDVQELDGMRGAVEKASVFQLAKKSADAFDGVKDKIGLCGDLIAESRGFADTCDEVIVSFGGVWDLESAQNHMVELFKIVSLGKLIRHFAQEIMKLVRANIVLMEAVRRKFKEIDFVPDKVEDFIDDVGDDLKEMGDKLKFWK